MTTILALDVAELFRPHAASSDRCAFLVQQPLASAVVNENLK